ncbi:MAG: MraY family glycosyltransferase [Patescibacteria group bacterium]|jgi:UDP-GlcNAc:undecaprenyl-phosphate GlcNAc-1-phosphate transferase
MEILFTKFNFVLAFALAFLVTLLFTYLIRKVALQYQIVDRPNKKRKIHRNNMPLMGGLAIYLGFFISLSYFILIDRDFFSGYMLPKYILGLALGGLILIIGGIIDDKYNLSPKKQFIFPIISCLIVIVSGIGITFISNPFGNTINLDEIKIQLFTINNIPYFFTVFADIFTLIWLLGMIYTTKFLDGMDGLVSGISVIASVILFFLSLSTKVMQPETALLCIILAGASLGFLIFNFHPAKIFLGEGGSTLIGFMLGALAIISGGKIATALLIMGIPILDVIWVILRRIFKHKSPFEADRQHLHFRLYDLGFSQRTAVIFLWSISALFGLFALFIQGKDKILAFAILLGLMVILAILLVIFFKKKQTRKSVKGSR